MKNAFIATQGPKPNTVGDFWRMIIEKNVSYIVMLTPLIDRGKVYRLNTLYLSESCDGSVKSSYLLHQYARATESTQKF